MVLIFRKYTTTFFMWAVGIISVAADMLQKPDVALYTAIALILVGTVCVVLGPSVIDHVAKQILGVRIEADFASRRFGLMALLLAGIVFVSSQLTAKAEDEGRPGYLADTFPKLHSLQLSLGLLDKEIKLVQQQQVALKQDTTELVDASARWIKFDLRAKDEMIIRMGPEGHLYEPRGGGWVLSNTTNFMFDDMELVLSTPEKVEIGRSAIGFLKSNDERWQDAAFSQSYPTVTFCVSAKRRERDEWLVEKVTYRREKPGPHQISRYLPIDATGLQSSRKPTKC